MKFAITTSRDPKNSAEQAKSIAAELSIPYLPREQQSLRSLLGRYELDFLLVAEKDRLILQGPDSEFFWHPNMAAIRLKTLSSGKKDQMVEAMGLGEGYKVLDCTFGLGADALVAAYVVGDTGSVTGLESNPLIYYISKKGLESYQAENKHIKRLISRINLYNCDYQEYLSALPDKSYDIVYFDPMFRHKEDKSSGLQGLRQIANSEALNTGAIAAALRVARKRVVLKEHSNSREFQRLEATRVLGGKYSSVAYGIWDLSIEEN